MKIIQVQDYDASACPQCKSEDLEVGKCGDTWQRMSCNNCNATYTEIYELIRIELDEEGD